MSATQTSLLTLQSDVWRARAHAKQKWLERSLAEPIVSEGQAARRRTWIKEALHAVKRGQDEIKYQAALLDAYAGHLNALEMSLIAAAELTGERSEV